MSKFIQYKTWLNEKFVEKSNPLKDMGIGMLPVIDDYLNTNFPWVKFGTPRDKLMVLIRIEHLKFIEALIDIYSLDIYECIDYAIIYNKLKVVKVLIDKNTNVLKEKADDLFLRPAGFYLHLRGLEPRGADQPAQRISVSHDRYNPGGRRHHRQVRRGCDHRLLERSP